MKGRVSPESKQFVLSLQLDQLGVIILQLLDQFGSAHHHPQFPLHVLPLPGLADKIALVLHLAPRHVHLQDLPIELLVLPSDGGDLVLDRSQPSLVVLQDLAELSFHRVDVVLQLLRRLLIWKTSGLALQVPLHFFRHCYRFRGPQVLLQILQFVLLALVLPLLQQNTWKVDTCVGKYAISTTSMVYVGEKISNFDQIDFFFFQFFAFFRYVGNVLPLPRPQDLQEKEN